jgi:cytochrome c556
MKNRLGLIALVLWLATAALGGVLFVHGRTAQAPDGRTAVLMSAEEREMVFGEMRGLLAGVRDITEALADSDPIRVVGLAKAMGMGEAHDKAPALLAKLPLDFKRQALALHGGFDEMAVAAATGSTPAEINRLLIAQLNRCTTCHAAYRIDIAQ